MVSASIRPKEKQFSRLYKTAAKIIDPSNEGRAQD